MKGQNKTTTQFSNVKITESETFYPAENLTRICKTVSIKTRKRVLTLQKVVVTDADGKVTMKTERQQIGGQKVKFYVTDILGWVKAGFYLAKEANV